ncbi:hypothetical protein SEVIR_9G182701v4 [Setaria viridis]
MWSRGKKEETVWREKGEAQPGKLGARLAPPPPRAPLFFPPLTALPPFRRRSRVRGLLSRASAAAAAAAEASLPYCIAVDLRLSCDSDADDLRPRRIPNTHLLRGQGAEQPSADI